MCFIVHVCVWPLVLPAGLADVFPSRLSTQGLGSHPSNLAPSASCFAFTIRTLFGFPSSSWLCQAYANQYEWPLPMQNLFWLPFPLSLGDVGSPVVGMPWSRAQMGAEVSGYTEMVGGGGRGVRGGRGVPLGRRDQHSCLLGFLGNSVHSSASTEPSRTLSLSSLCVCVDYWSTGTE